MTEILIMSLLPLIMGVTKAVQDKLQFHFEHSVFSKLGDWWNPQDSWKLKWKNGDKAQGERFWLSSTLLVSLTDAWHFFGLLRNFSVFLLLGILINPIYIVYYPIFFVTFHLTFTYFFETTWLKK